MRSACKTREQALLPLVLSLFKSQTRAVLTRYKLLGLEGPIRAVVRQAVSIRGESEKDAVNLCRKFPPKITSSPINSSGVAQLICFELRMPLVKRADKINETGTREG